MTSKQEAFVNCVVGGMNPSEAYRNAYDAGNMSAKSISVEAQRLLTNPNIALAVREGRERASMRAVWSRKTSIERNQKINEVAYGQLVGGDLSKDVMTAFSVTDRRLYDLLDLEHERDLMRQGLDNEVAQLDPLQFLTKPTRADIRRVIDAEEASQ